MKLLYVIGAALLLVWVVGFLFKFVISPLIHLALVVGLVLFAWNFFAGGGRRTV